MISVPLTTSLLSEDFLVFDLGLNGNNKYNKNNKGNSNSMKTTMHLYHLNIYTLHPIDAWPPLHRPKSIPTPPPSNSSNKPTVKFS